MLLEEERAALPDTTAVQRRGQAPGAKAADLPGFGHLTLVRCAPPAGS